MESWILILISALAGLAVGALITYFALPRARAGRSAEAVQKEFDAYREDVAEHFARTARLVNTMTDSYKDVFEHLREGAQTLLSEEQAREKLADQSGEVITLKKLGQREEKTEPETKRLKEAEKPGPEVESEMENVSPVRDVEVEPEPEADSDALDFEDRKPSERPADGAS